MIQKILYHSPLGTLYLEADSKGITKTTFDIPVTNDRIYYNTNSNDPILTKATQWLNSYFKGKDPGIIPPLHPQGTSFQRRTWQLVTGIPYGYTASYGTIAEQLAAEKGIFKMSAQAVGGAVKRNPIAIFIPCHRVVAANGIGGYFSHIERKIALLTLEGVDMRPFLPRTL